MGLEVTIFSLFGLVALTGVVVNDSLILVDFVGQRRRAGAGFMEAVLESGRLRFRPIVLTSVTTMLALLAIVLFGGAVLRDFALAMMWGVLIGTYSSIFVAVGMLAVFDLKKNLDEDEDPGVMREEG